MVQFTKLYTVCCWYFCFLSPTWLDWIPDPAFCHRSLSESNLCVAYGWSKGHKNSMQLYSSFLKSTKEKLGRGIGKFLLVISNGPEDGGECFRGHCLHRKQGTVGVLSPSIVSFHWGLEDSQHCLLLDNNKRVRKVVVFLLRVGVGGGSRLTLYK